jgi:hypothetical protein
MSPPDAALVEEEAKVLKTLTSGILLSTALAASGALGEDNRAVPKNQPAQAQPAADVESANQIDASQAPSGISFMTAQGKTEWRAPKLVGVGVFGPDDKQIGKIDDLLIDHNGAAQTVVIGVGGFLGFGKKDVAVPFAAIKWRTEGRKIPTTNQNIPATNQPPANPVVQDAGSTVQPTTKETDRAATEASQGYPDKAILKVTLGQLKAAPDFKYAGSPLAESETRPTGDGEPMKKTTP